MKDRKLWKKYMSFSIFLWVISIAYILINTEHLTYYGVGLGKWEDNFITYFCLSVGIISIARFTDYKSKGRLLFKLPALSTILFYLVVVGLGEELLFRGIIQTEFGFWIATLSFGLFHGFNGLTLYKKVLPVSYLIRNGLSIMAACGFGAIMGYVFILTDSIFAVAFLHGLFNLANHMWVAEAEVH